MKYLLFKSRNDLYNYTLHELLYFRYRIFLDSRNFPVSIKLKLMKHLSKKYVSLTRFKKRCVATGFNRSYRRLCFSRITFREFVSYGYFNGFRKSS